MSSLVGLPNIAFTGKAGAGKTTAATLLGDEFGYRPLSFANPLKREARLLFGRADREICLRFGAACRAVDENVWVNLLLARLTHPVGGHIAPIAIDDLRFPNEYWVLKAEGFVVVRVTAPQPLRGDRLKGNGKWQNDAQLLHTSETAMDEVTPDYSIENAGDLEEMLAALETIIAKERKRR